MSDSEFRTLQLAGALLGTAPGLDPAGALAVETPHGLATQLMLPEFETLQQSINAGATPIYRAGQFERPLISGNQIDLRRWSYAAEGQFWGLTNPAIDVNYARNVGAASIEGSGFDWIIKARRDPLGALGITRQAPAFSGNVGGDPEFVLPPGVAGSRLPPVAGAPPPDLTRLNVRIDWFHMPDP